MNILFLVVNPHPLIGKNQVAIDGWREIKNIITNQIVRLSGEIGFLEAFTGFQPELIQ